MMKRCIIHPYPTTSKHLFKENTTSQHPPSASQPSHVREAWIGPGCVSRHPYKSRLWHIAWEVSEHRKAARATSSVRSEFYRATSTSINLPQSFHQVPSISCQSPWCTCNLGPLTDQIPSISAVRKRRPQCWWGRVQIPSQRRSPCSINPTENWQFRFGDSAKQLSKHGLPKLKTPHTNTLSSHQSNSVHAWVRLKKKEEILHYWRDWPLSTHRSLKPYWLRS